MALSDAAVVGAPIVAESHWADGFRDDFSTFDAETSSAPGNRTGKWHKEFMHANISEFDFTYGADEGNVAGDNFVHAAINNEEQAYDSVRKPNPSGQGSFSVQDSVLTIASRKASGSVETEWARVKDFVKNPDGTNGEFLRNKKVKYLSGMISTYGRYAASFFRGRARVRTPYGADGSSADINQRSAVFPAAEWYLQDVPYGMDLNGDPRPDGRSTYRPGRPNGGGILHEIDADENFGESETAIHQTVHAHPPGTPDGSSSSSPLRVDTGKNLRQQWRITGVDVFPEKIAFHVDGIYTHVVPTTDEIRYGLPKYVPITGEEYRQVMVNSTEAQTDGRQKHADGSTRYMCHVMICNLARDGKYPRDLARQEYEAGRYLPPHLDTVTMQIDWVEMRPLITDNPDNFPIRVNGVPTSLEGAVGGDDPPEYVPSLNVPYRSNVSIDNVDETVAGAVIQASARLPYGVARSSKTYDWTVSSHFEILSQSADGFEITLLVVANPDQGTTQTGTIELLTPDDPATDELE